MASLPDGMIFSYATDIKGTAISIHQRELVMCRNCKYYWDSKITSHQTPGCKWRVDETPAPTDFCSHGKKADRSDG